MGFPVSRSRRLRTNDILRGLVRETEVSTRHLVYPLFVKEMSDDKIPIPSMPDVYQFSLDGILKEVEELIGLSIPAILLFGIPEKKDEAGSGAVDKNGIIPRTVREIKKRFGNSIFIITDVCLCEYTSHGHCGIVNNGIIDNDETLKVLSRSALAHVLSGADMVAPSDMMDGRVRAVREMLDLHGDYNLPIMSYSAKYASSLYGPFRDAAECAPRFGDRRSYQMDPANEREAMREIALDIEEGADIIMVKPALFYLDVLARARKSFDVPLAAYSVSGEYSMIKAASANGWLDYRQTVTEALTGIRRAGADIIITYFAKDFARWNKEHSL
ncbi:MAG TPA: porphobilinogen synthase [Syntrophorhabdaceae bacterium]|nr:porphobilinogen synthase [Syntrophorhabdaceae bacterium]